MTTSLECPKCGTVYKGRAIGHLRVNWNRYKRDAEGVYQPAACLCEHNEHGHAKDFSLRQRLYHHGLVIIEGGGGWSGNQSLCKPIRRQGKTRIVVQPEHGSELVYRIKDGCEYGGGKSHLSEEELAVAMRILDAMEKGGVK